MYPKRDPNFDNHRYISSTVVLLRGVFLPERSGQAREGNPGTPRSLQKRNSPKGSVEGSIRVLYKGITYYKFRVISGPE